MLTYHRWAFYPSIEKGIKMKNKSIKIIGDLLTWVIEFMGLCLFGAILVSLGALEESGLGFRDGNVVMEWQRFIQLVLFVMAFSLFEFSQNKLKGKSKALKIGVLVSVVGGFIASSYIAIYFLQKYNLYHAEILNINIILFIIGLILFIGIECFILFKYKLRLWEPTTDVATNDIYDQITKK